MVAAGSLVLRETGGTRSGEVGAHRLVSPESCAMAEKHKGRPRMFRDRPERSDKPLGGDHAVQGLPVAVHFQGAPAFSFLQFTPLSLALPNVA